MSAHTEKNKLGRSSIQTLSRLIFSEPLKKGKDRWTEVWMNEFTLPQLNDSCCDELHGETHQVVFRAVSIKLLWFLHTKRMVRKNVLLTKLSPIGTDESNTTNASASAKKMLLEIVHLTYYISHDHFNINLNIPFYLIQHIIIT